MTQTDMVDEAGTRRRVLLALACLVGMLLLTFGPQIDDMRRGAAFLGLFGLFWLRRAAQLERGRWHLLTAMRARWTPTIVMALLVFGDAALHLPMTLGRPLLVGVGMGLLESWRRSRTRRYAPRFQPDEKNGA
jgi:hypothetical protein